MSNKKNIKKFSILGINFHQITIIELCDLIFSNIDKKKYDFVTFRDTASFISIQEDERLKYIQNNEVTLSIVDGWPLEFASKFEGYKISRIPGPDFFSKFIKKNYKLRHYFIGSTQKNLILLKKQLEIFNYVEVVGINSPIFDDMTDKDYKELSESLKESRADIIWLGISSPKQEKMISKLQIENKATFIAVGAALDFYTKKQKRAPLVMRKLYLEWFYRLILNPKRLMKRYFIQVPKFFLKYIGSKLII